MIERLCPYCQTPITRHPRERDDAFARRKTCGASACMIQQRNQTQRTNAVERGYTTNAPTDREDWWRSIGPNLFTTEAFHQHNLHQRPNYARLPSPHTNNPLTKSGIADL